MTNKIVIGLLAGLILGAADGSTAWFYPEARTLMASIMVGAAIGLLFAFLVAGMNTVNGRHPYLEIMFPGFVVGAIIGFLTQKMGTSPMRRQES